MTAADACRCGHDKGIHSEVGSGGACWHGNCRCARWQPEAAPDDEGRGRLPEWCVCPDDCDCDGVLVCGEQAGTTTRYCQEQQGHDGPHIAGNHRWTTPAPLSGTTPRDAEAAWEARIQADFEGHPGSWRGDPENWFREGWIAGWGEGNTDGWDEALDAVENDLRLGGADPWTLARIQVLRGVVPSREVRGKHE